MNKDGKFSIPSHIELLSPIKVEEYIKGLFARRPEFLPKTSLPKEGDAQSNQKALETPFYYNIVEEYIVLPTPTTDTLDLFNLTVKLYKRNFPKGRIGIVNSDAAIGLSSEDIGRFCLSIANAFDVFEVKAKGFDITSSFLAKDFIEYFIKKYQCQFFSMGKGGKLATQNAFFNALLAKPTMKGKSESLSFKYMRLIFRLMIRLFNMSITEEGEVDNDCKAFVSNYIASTYSKPTLKEWITNNGLKVYNLQSIETVLLPGESMHIDLLGLGRLVPDNEAKTFAIRDKLISSGDYKCVVSIHDTNRQIKEAIGENALGLIYKRMSVRSKVCARNDVTRYARSNKISPFKISLLDLLKFMTKEEVTLWRPGVLSSLIERAATNEKDSGKFRSSIIFKSKKDVAGHSVLIADFQPTIYNQKLREGLLQRYPQDIIAVRKLFPKEEPERQDELLEIGLAQHQESLSRIDAIVGFVSDDVKNTNDILIKYNI